MVPIKGLPVLLKAVAIMKTPQLMLSLLLVEDGGIREELETQTRDLGISENVMFAGHREDTDDLLRAMDIFVLPSLSEGIRMALLEAMATSRPFIASRASGIPEIVDDGIEGLLVEPRDVNGLTERCFQLTQSPDMAQKMPETARRRIEPDFSAEDMALRVSSLYEELIESRSDGSRWAVRCEVLTTSRDDYGKLNTSLS
jgi:glycosyltransferase involved in cell wall biosynthesis